MLGKLVRGGLFSDRGHAVAGAGLGLRARPTGLDEVAAVLGLGISRLGVVRRRGSLESLSKVVLPETRPTRVR